MKIDEKTGRYIETFDVNLAKKMHHEHKMSMAEIAIKFGISKSTISYAFKRHGIDVLTRSSQKISSDDLIKEVNLGLSLTDLSIKYKISTKALEKRIDKLNLKTSLAKSKPGVKSRVDENYLISLVNQGYTKPQISEKLCISITHVSRLLRKNNIALSVSRSWENKSYREKQLHNSDSEFQSKLQKEAWSDPILREQHSCKMQQLWKNEEYRNKQIAVWNRKEIRNSQSAKAKKVWDNEEYRNKMAKIRETMPRSLTKPHKKVCDILDYLNVSYTVEYAVGPYNFDIYIPHKDMLIEVQGNYWHSLPAHIRNDKSKSTYVEKYHSKYSLKYIWEHECLEIGKVEAKLKYWLGIDTINNVEYDFNSLKIADVDRSVVDTFLYNWHYQHHGRHGIDYGCYLDNELICVARFVSPNRNESATSLGYRPSDVLELSRLCVHPRYQKKNLLSWFLSRIEKLVCLNHSKVKCLISFADSTFNHTGTVYKAANWTLNRIVEPDYWYVDNEGWVVHKKTLWNHASKMGIKESEYSLRYGYTKVYGKEKYKFIKILD